MNVIEIIYSRDTMDNKELWNKALVDIELEVSKANFSTWFKNTRIIKQDVVLRSSEYKMSLSVIGSSINITR